MIHEDELRCVSMSNTYVLDWLKSGDPSIKRLTEVYLQNLQAPYVSLGWIKQYIDLFDLKTNMWGGGIYGPKWISTFYTLKDLKSLEIDPKDPIYQKGLDTIVYHMWNHKMWKEDDVCVVGMMISMLAYGRYDTQIIDEMIFYLFKHHQSDGGWNCQDHRSEKSSVHTTLSVLEALSDYKRYGYQTYSHEIKSYQQSGEAFLLKKHLYLSETTHEPMFPRITDFHFPTRWFYDVLKALEYFQSVSHPYHPHMKEALDILKSKFERGYLTKGTTHSGRLHFKLEETYAGRMNTLRGLKVIQFYDPTLYEKLISTEINPK
jgi:hypothetical protein